MRRRLVGDHRLIGSDVDHHHAVALDEGAPGARSGKGEAAVAVAHDKKMMVSELAGARE
jgi:hypothetical protein